MGPVDEFPDVHWLNFRAQEGEVSRVRMKYGNEYSLEWHYSYAAILIDIAPRRERKSVPDSGFGFPDFHAGSRGVDDVSSAGFH